MKYRVLHCLLAGAVVAACAQTQEAPKEARHSRPPIERHRLAQVDYGGQAKFMVCEDERCPTRTPKTLASTEPVRAVVLPIPDGPPPAAPASLPPVRTANTDELTLEFPFGGVALTPPARAKLRSAFGRLNKATRIVIKGRSDAVGTEPANDRIALARAVSVRNYLRQLSPTAAGVIVVESKGSCCYVADNDSPASRARNRRVEIVFQYEG